MNEQAFPLELKRRSARVRIYRTRNQGYEQFRLAHYGSGKRKLETFSDLDRALTRARAVLRELNTKRRTQPS